MFEVVTNNQTLYNFPNRNVRRGKSVWIIMPFYVNCTVKNALPKRVSTIFSPQQRKQHIFKHVQFDLLRHFLYLLNRFTVSITVTYDTSSPYFHIKNFFIEPFTLNWLCIYFFFAITVLFDRTSRRSHFSNQFFNSLWIKPYEIGIKTSLSYSLCLCIPSTWQYQVIIFKC